MTGHGLDPVKGQRSKRTAKLSIYILQATHVKVVGVEFGGRLAGVHDKSML